MSEPDFTNSETKTDLILNKTALLNHAKELVSSYKNNKNLLLIGLIKSNISIDFIKNFLQITEEDIQETINQDFLNISISTKKPYDPTKSRKNNWSVYHLQILTGLWLLQAPTSLICEILSEITGSDKSISSIYYIRKKLALPTRRKLKIISETEEDILTWEEASALQSSVKKNKIWPIKNSDRNCYIKTNSKGHIEWADQDLIRELSNRWWANQHPDNIARDFATSNSAIKSMAYWIGLPKRDRHMLVPDYKPEIAKENAEKAGYIIKKCIFDLTKVFWGKKIGGNRISLKSRKSQNFKNIL